MKIDINKLKTTPESFGFNFSVYGEISNEIQEWINYWGFKVETHKNYNNIIIGNVNINDIFINSNQYKWMDGFSPNLCKKLHIGHLSNFVIGKALQKLEVSKNYISILGDTVSGDIDKESSFEYFKSFCKKWDYKIDLITKASDMTLTNTSILKDGEGDFLGTKIFDINGNKIVGIKSSGLTTYFYQDVALAQKLNSSTLYLTGQEQESHFKMLKEIFPTISHIPLGLVMYNGKKMSTSEGNVIFLEDLFSNLLEIFPDEKLVWNILACQILKSTPSGNKSIDTKIISNPKLSPGLYLSYTLAHIKSCGVNVNKQNDFTSQELSYNYLKAKNMLQPNILLDSLISHAKNINNLYSKNYIKGNSENIKLFSGLISDLEFGMDKIGLYSIDDV